MQTKAAGWCHIHIWIHFHQGLVRWVLECTLYSPTALVLLAGGKLTSRVACKPLLSMCSRVIYQLSCSCRQSFGEIASILVHPLSLELELAMVPWSLYITPKPLVHFSFSHTFSGLFLIPYVFLFYFFLCTAFTVLLWVIIEQRCNFLSFCFTV